MKALPDLNGKVLLLLGNGSSTKELYFLKSNARLIFTDISLNAVIAMKNRFDYGAYRDAICFHAVDACNIPLNDESVDIVVGYAFVHHLEDIDAFLGGVHRVLKPGGVCLFFDNAYAPVYQKSKLTVLRPLMEWMHRRYPISPEDLRATIKGGFTAEEIAVIQKKYGFERLIYNRFGFFHYLSKRGCEKLLPKALYRRPATRAFVKSLSRILFKVDVALARFSHTFHDNTLQLVWGLKK
jgi:ubiquinone/menaquinone biosynthesis C-methylase UbiE